MDAREFNEITAEGGYIAGGSPVHGFMHSAAAEARRITCEINGGFHTDGELRALFAELTGSDPGEGFGLFPPFYTDYGRNIKLGRRVFINSGCCFQDQGGIEIGDGSLIGHQVVIATLNHDPDPEKRAGMIPAPVKIGRNVWIGAHATILPGVTVGDGAIIGGGAVVTKNIPAYAVAVGVPARVIKSVKKGDIS